MGVIFEPVYSFLGMSFEAFELLFSAVFAALFLLVIILLFTLRKRGTVVNRSKAMVRKLGRDVEEGQKRLKSSEKERLEVIGQHEEALAKLKEAKEVILSQDSEFKTFKGNFKDDFSKLSAMEEELKTYRIKLGELNKEKEKMMAEYESINQVSEKEKSNLKSKFDKDLEVQKKKISSQQQDFEDEIEKRVRLHDRRIEEIKTQTKDSITKLTMEKDREIDDLKIEIEKSRKQIEKLKEEIRVLEIEKL
jgi:chromosome segregation ATPase